MIIDAAEQAAAGIIEDAEAQARKYIEESRIRAERIAAQRATKMWALTDDLIARAEAVKQQSDELLRALDDAKHGVEEAVQGGYGLPGAEPPPIDRLRSVSSPEQPPPVSRQAPPPVVEPAPPARPQSAEPPPEQPAVPEQAPPQDASPAAPPWAPSEPSPPVEQPPHPHAESPPPRYEEAPTPPPRPAPSQPSEGARLLATQMAVAGSNREEIESRLSREFGIHDTGPMLDAILGPER